MINTVDGKPAMKGVLSGARMGGTLSLLSSTPNLTRTVLGNGPWAFAWIPNDHTSAPFAARVANSGADRVTAICLSQYGTVMVAGASDGSLTVYSLSTPGPPSILVGYQEPIVIARLVLPSLPLGVRPDPSMVPRAIGVSRSGNVIAAAFGNNMIVWMAVLRPNEYLNLEPYGDRLTGPVPPTLTVSHGGKVTQVYVSADGTSAFTGACDGTVSAWDLTLGGKQAGQVMISGTGSTTACCTAIAFGRPSSVSGSALLVVTASDDDGGRVRLWSDKWIYSDAPEV